MNSNLSLPQLEIPCNSSGALASNNLMTFLSPTDFFRTSPMDPDMMRPSPLLYNMPSPSPQRDIRPCNSPIRRPIIEKRREQSSSPMKIDGPEYQKPSMGATYSPNLLFNLPPGHTLANQKLCPTPLRKLDGMRSPCNNASRGATFKCPRELPGKDIPVPRRFTSMTPRGEQVFGTKFGNAFFSY